VIVCEGYTDVTAFFRVGLPKAVATCGTALTDDHVQILRRFARRIVLAFDADAAGQAAADRFYQWESRFDLDVAVAVLPAGVDPADLAGRDPAALVAAVEGARPFLEFRVARILDGAALDSAEHRARAAEAALAVIAEHPNDLVRDQYLMLVADRCRLDVNRLRERGAERHRSHNGDRRPTERAAAGHTSTRPPVPSSPADSPAVEVLRLAVNRPETVVDWLDECLFDDPIHAEAYRTLVAAATIHEAIESAPPAVAALLSRLAVEEPVEDAFDPVMLLLRATGKRLIARIRSAAEPDLELLADVARLVDAVGSDDRGIVAAGQLLSLASQTGGVR
jgi:DNA primase